MSNGITRSVPDAMLPGVRWSILRTIHVGGYLGATEVMMREVVNVEYLGVTRDFIRTQLDYLAKRKLIALERSELHPWRATLSRYGHDVVEYQVDCEPGVSRPPRIGG